MVKYHVILLGLIAFFGSLAHATSPCASPEKQWFIDNVIQKSDLVVYAKIKDYSHTNNSAEWWTKVEVLQILRGDIDSPNELLIEDWQANLFPVEIHKKGAHVVLWLRRVNNKLYRTSLKAGVCSPSVWVAYQGGFTYDPIGKKRVSIKEIERLISKTIKKPARKI